MTRKLLVKNNENDKSILKTKMRCILLLSQKDRERERLLFYEEHLEGIDGLIGRTAIT